MRILLQRFLQWPLGSSMILLIGGFDELEVEGIEGSETCWLSGSQSVCVHSYAGFSRWQPDFQQMCSPRGHRFPALTLRQHFPRLKNPQMGLPSLFLSVHPSGNGWPQRLNSLALARLRWLRMVGVITKGCLVWDIWLRRQKVEDLR